VKHLVYVSFRCPIELERQTRVEAAKRDMNRTQFIIVALQEKLERIDAKSTQNQVKPNA
jgi:hypothetical protein